MAQVLLSNSCFEPYSRSISEYDTDNSKVNVKSDVLTCKTLTGNRFSRLPAVLILQDDVFETYKTIDFVQELHSIDPITILSINS